MLTSLFNQTLYGVEKNNGEYIISTPLKTGNDRYLLMTVEFSDEYHYILYGDIRQTIGIDNATIKKHEPLIKRILSQQNDKFELKQQNIIIHADIRKNDFYQNQLEIDLHDMTKILCELDVLNQLD